MTKETHDIVVKFCIAIFILGSSLGSGIVYALTSDWWRAGVTLTIALVAAVPSYHLAGQLDRIKRESKI